MSITFVDNEKFAQVETLLYWVPGLPEDCSIQYDWILGYFVVRGGDRLTGFYRNPGRAVEEFQRMEATRGSFSQAGDSAG